MIKRILLLSLTGVLMTGMAGCRLADGYEKRKTAETDTMEQIPEIEEAFEKTLQSYEEQMGKVSQQMKDNFESLKELNYKAFAYCGTAYFVQTDIINADEMRTIRTYVQDDNVRREEYVEDSIAYVQVYNAEEDVYYEYDAAKGELTKITNAKQKGWNMGGYTCGFFEWKSCNAPQGKRSETELNGRKAELYDYDMGANGYNGVWYDAEYGIPMKFIQGQWMEVYTVVPKTSFGEESFAFDGTNLTMDLSLVDIQSSKYSYSEAEKSEENVIDEGTLSLETLSRIPDFTSKDMNGSQVDNEIFAEYELTLVNLWGTWCSPCVAEMPGLQKLYEKYHQNGLNIIGVTEDAKGNEELVQEIVDTQEVSYTILYPDDQFYDDFVSLCFTYPTSVLVDSEGKILEVIEGDPGYEKLEKTVTCFLHL